MKKQLQRLFAIILLASITVTSYAQEEVRARGFEGKGLNAINNPTADLKAKANYSNWRFPVNGVANLTTLNQFVNFLYPDSSVVFVPADGASFFYNWHSVGAVFTPNDPNLELEGDNITLSRHNEYTVDSIFFPYLYVRYLDSVMLNGNQTEVVDTLVVQFFRSDQMELGMFPNQQNQNEIFMKPTNWTQNRLGSNRPAAEMKIPLRGADSTSRPTAEGWIQAPMRIALPDGFNIDSDAATSALQYTNAFGFSFAYKPMLSNNFGDTLETLEGSNVTNRVNYFGHSFLSNSSVAVEQLEYINNSWWVPSEIAYEGDQMGWTNNIPGNAYFQDRYINYAIHFSTTTLSTDKIDNTITYGVYPNPISANQTLKADFNLVNPADVSIEIYDILGNKVKHVVDGYYTAGEHQIDASISDLTPGMYIYSVKAGNAVSTKKISVVE